MTRRGFAGNGRVTELAGRIVASQDIPAMFGDTAAICWMGSCCGGGVWRSATEPS
ncbi:hypothetical protein PMI03_00181 [Rhizobium sp. AP16]|nr:hypothetical protein PMI03_00181 [Rhizobium sp. AP16]